MFCTSATSWTSKTVDLFRDHSHVDCKPLLKKLIPGTLEKGIRFLSRQTKPTEGVRPLRLDAWYYVRRVSVDEVICVLRDSGYASDSLRQSVRDAMDAQTLYHVVIRGNDPEFMPLGNVNGQDIVTHYPLEQIELVHKDVDRYLFEELGDAQAVHQAMSDSCFDTMLESYFRSGDIHAEETLHVVSRFHGGWNILHTCIKEGHLETLRLLLKRYTLESHGHEGRWRVLAEPLRGVGKYKVSAFHRAVYDGQQECLKELVAWALRHGHDITQIRNVEERTRVGEPTRGLTCLELAQEESNYGCYNILAPVFGLPTKDLGVDMNPRSARLATREAPRIELVFELDDAVPLRILPISILDWTHVLIAVSDIRLSQESQSIDISRLSIRIYNVAFLSDATEEQIDELFALTEGMRAIEAIGCAMTTDRTCVRCLSVLVRRLEMDGVGHLPGRMPQKVQLVSTSTEDLAPEDEAHIDAEVGALLVRFTNSCGRWPGFLSARGDLICKKQRMRLASIGSGSAFAANVAAMHATRLAAFLCYSEDREADLEMWLRKQQLLPLARAVFSSFYSPQKLVASELADPGRALDGAVLEFLMRSLSAWFVTAPRHADGDPWRQWAQRLRADEQTVKQELAPAVDLVLETLLRMWKVLDPLCASPRNQHLKVKSIGGLVRQAVPESLFCRLPKTRARLSKYYGDYAAQAIVGARKRCDLLSVPMPGSLRPRGSPGSL